MKTYKFKINGNDYTVAVNSVDDNEANVTVNGVDYTVEVEGVAAKTKTPKLVQSPVVPSTDAHPAVAKTAKPQAAGAGTPVKSPLPGVVLNLAVKVGDHVSVGQRLLILEAMKMENNIDSDVEGIVKSVRVNQGDSVLEGDVLMTIG